MAMKTDPVHKQAMSNGNEIMSSSDNHLIERLLIMHWPVIDIMSIKNVIHKFTSF